MTSFKNLQLLCAGLFFCSFQYGWCCIEKFENKLNFENNSKSCFAEKKIQYPLSKTDISNPDFEDQVSSILYKY